MVGGVLCLCSGLGAFVYRCGETPQKLGLLDKHPGYVLNKPLAGLTLPILFTSQTLLAASGLFGRPAGLAATGGGGLGGRLGSQA